MRKINILTIFCFVLFALLCYTGTSYGQGAEFEWVRTAGSVNSDNGQGIAIDDSGYIYTTGQFAGNITLGSGNNSFTLASSGTGTDVFVAKLDSSGGVIWAQSYPSSGSTVANFIAVGKDGDIYITGEYSNGEAYFGSDTCSLFGGLDIFVARLKNDGTPIWGKGFGGASTDRGYGIAVDTDGSSYITGVYAGTVNFGSFTRTAQSGDIYVVKLNADGVFQWVTSMGGQKSDYGQHITVDKMGNVFAIVHYQENASFGSFALTGAFWTVGVVRLSGINGDVVWAKGFGGKYGQCWAEGRATPGSITVDNFGHIIATGLYQRMLDLDPSDNPADTFFIGGCDPPAMAYNSAFVVKLDTAGNFVWGKSLGGDIPKEGGRIWPYAIATDKAGNIYTTGDLMGSMDFDPGASSFFLEASYRIDTTMVVGTPPNLFYITNTVTNMDAFVSKLDSSGNFVWAKKLGANYLSSPETYARGKGIAIDKSGHVYTTGEFMEQPDFNPGPDSLIVAGKGAWDIYIHKLGCPADTGATIQAQADCNGYPINGLILTEPGMNYITYTGKGGCDSIVIVDLFVVLPEPVITIEVDTLSTIKSYVKYQWLKDGAVIAGATDAKYIVTENANYQVVVTDENGCSDTSDIYPVTNHGVSVDEMALLGRQVNIHPNPTRDMIYISSPVAVTATLAGIDGRIIANIENARHISLTELADGVYVLKITDLEGKLIKVQKIVKQ